ncbi:hypothetical protein C8R45DRAFT_1030672 [Mycena sanguinolenta]|nr:hypothetical protein C8R45DRAFT_1030672 [Mycena sanguinolenta]
MSASPAADERRARDTGNGGNADSGGGNTSTSNGGGGRAASQPPHQHATPSPKPSPFLSPTGTHPTSPWSQHSHSSHPHTILGIGPRAQRRSALPLDVRGRRAARSRGGGDSRTTPRTQRRGTTRPPRPTRRARDPAPDFPVHSLPGFGRSSRSALHRPHRLRGALSVAGGIGR